MRKNLDAFYAEDDGGEIFQESPRRKAAWLKAVKQDFPVGARVRVIQSDLAEYIEAEGVVADYDIGANEGRDGSWPMVIVTFDRTIVVDGHTTDRDGFYDDEIEHLSVKSS